MAESRSSVDELAARIAATLLSSPGAPESPVCSPGLRLQIPNPFDAAGASSEEPGVEDEDMPTASRLAGQLQQRVSAAPALPQPPRFEGRTMQDRRNFMRGYETYLTAINALQTQWSGAFAMPVGACIESKTKRMIARYEFNCSPERISEEQWIAYFKQANEPSHVDYAVVDEAMKQLRMHTKRPEPESRMMNLQADLEAILDRFNLAELAFEHEQRRLVRYLTNALEPASFRSVVATRLTLQENKKFKNEVVPFCTWVKVLLKEFMTWEQAANSVSSTPGLHGSTPSSSGRRGGRATEVEAVVLAEMVQPLLLHHPPELMVPTERPPRGGVALASSASRRSIKYGSARISGQAKPPSFSKRCGRDGSPPLRRACAVCKWRMMRLKT
ncbi:hypothetical protein PF005_g26709 [Phytophthora fragariae]|uniref:Uncharacterized protein n=2 Tax=Phytophthora fragariae TaxID=53985 RepID=A0A6A3VW74_9STRA|nr:hypothetical protein PF005_g26709 [Phytophthora fragariae]KAE9176276.1 hypothetical protein PF002_g28573 [Phytophthora fragariae]